MFSIRCARFVRPAILLAATLGLSVPAHAVYTSTLTGSAGGSYGSGNTGYGSDLVTGVPLAPVGSTGVHGLSNASGVNGFADISTHGVASSNINNGFGSFGVSASFAGVTTPFNNGTTAYNYYVSGSGYLSIHDYLMIAPSAAHPLDSQVVVTYSIQIFYTGAGDTDPANVTNPNADNATFSAYIGAGGGSPFGFSPSLGNPPASFYLDSEGNKTYNNTYTGNLTNGIFASASHHLDIPMTVRVGEIFDFVLNVQAAVYGNIAAAGNPLLPQGAWADSLLGVAFGATASDPIASAGLDSFSTLSNDLLISSQLFGTFPDASNANAPNAFLAGGLQVPEPASFALLLVSGITLRRRRR